MNHAQSIDISSLLVLSLSYSSFFRVLGMLPVNYTILDFLALTQFTIVAGQPSIHLFFD